MLFPRTGDEEAVRPFTNGDDAVRSTDSDGQLRIAASIAAVSEAYQNWYGKPLAQKDELSVALAAVSASVDAHRKERELALIRGADSVHALSRIVISSAQAIPDPPMCKPLLRSIDRHFSENLHSDFLAATLC